MAQMHYECEGEEELEATRATRKPIRRDLWDIRDDIAAHGKSAVPPLIAALKDPCSHMRGSAAYCLVMIGPSASEAVPHLIQALKDDKCAFVRSNSIVALEKIGVRNTNVEAALRNALGDEDDTVRSFAASTLAALFEGE